MGMMEVNKTTPENRPALQKLSEIPELPGIYQMLDSKGNIIYIGKSKCLKKRVRSYFVESPHWDKAKKMASFIYDIHYTVTDTHLEAMLLECEMIKQIKPHFNALMKNDERYVYLTVADQNISGRAKGRFLKVTYEREKISFGPFRSRSRVQEFTDSMENLYPFSEKRKNLQFEYHILPEKMEMEERSETVRLLIRLLSDPEVMQKFQKDLEKRMKRAAREEKFETALKYRDLLEHADYICKNLLEYHHWMNRQMVYVEDTCKGRKYFFIDNGLVIHKAMKEENIREEIWQKKFVEEGQKVLTEQRNTEQEGQTAWNGLTEKQKVDYQDIVFSECMQNAGSVLWIQD